MDDSKKLQESVSLISKHFGISQSEFVDEAQIEFIHSDLLVKLQRVVAYLLDHDFQRLINGLYRIDVAETDVAKVLQQSEPAKAIAELILERELQKVETRRRYSK